MRKNILTPVLCASAIVGTLMLSGCGSSTTTPITTTPIATSQTTPVTSLTATAAMTGADIGTKLTTAGFAFTAEDQASKIAKLSTKDAVSKGTKFKMKGTDGNNVDVTVLELSKTEKMNELKKEIDAQFTIVKQISPTMNTGFIDVGAENLLTMISYRTADKDLAIKATLAITKK